MRPLATIWTQHLPEEERRDLETAIRNSRIGLTRLYEILSSEEARLVRDLANPDFTEAAFSEHLAHRLGDLSRIKKLKDLLSPIVG